MYNLQHLSMFVETVKSGSFSACARKLGKAQSAVSQGIANLELDLGNELFDRSQHKPTLTPQGERLLSYASAILSQVYEMDCAAQALGKQDESRLTLAIDSALYTPKLEDILAEFSQRFVATALELNTMASPDVVSQVSQEQAHLGLMIADMSMPENVDICYLGNLPFYAVASPSHPLSNHASIHVAQLIAHRQLLLKGVAGHSLEHFTPMSAQLWWCNDFTVMRDLIKRGVGWSYVPSHLVEQDIAAGKLCNLPVSMDQKPWNTPVDCIMAKNQPMGPALTWLSGEVKRFFGEETFSI